MRTLGMVFIALIFTGLFMVLIKHQRETKRNIEKEIDYTISIKDGIVTVRNVGSNEVVGRDVLDSLSVIIVNDNK
jgi:hypothetical protein